MKKLASFLVLLSLCTFSLAGCSDADKPIEGAASSVDEEGDDGSATTDEEGSATTDEGETK